MVSFKIELRLSRSYVGGEDRREYAALQTILICMKILNKTEFRFAFFVFFLIFKGFCKDLEHVLLMRSQLFYEKKKINKKIK